MRIRWAGHVGCMEELQNSHKIILRKPEGKRPLERPRHRWGKIVTDLRETGCEDVVWSKVHGGSYEHGNEPSGSIQYQELLDQLSDY
jgi:hypothetical protein